jgi:hypothetical protein
VKFPDVAVPSAKTARKPVNQRWFYEPVVEPSQVALLSIGDGVSSGHPHVDPVAPLKTDMEGSSETPYDPSSAFDPPVDPVVPMKTDVEGSSETPYDPSSAFDSHVDPVAPMKTDMEGSSETPYDPLSAFDHREAIDDRPSGVAFVDPKANCATDLSRVCSSSGSSDLSSVSSSSSVPVTPGAANAGPLLTL